MLKKVKKELSQKEKLRQDAQEKMRKTTSRSKQAILLSHQKRLKEAKEQIEKAKDLIAALQEQAKTYPSIIYCGMFTAALQEYAEANIFVKLIEESKFSTPEEIGVPSVDYILGLSDVVGECRRAVLDALREGDVGKGEKFLKTMDEIYIELMALDETYMLVPGLRRKCDVARRIIESTRGDITQEVRRKSLEDYLRSFEMKHMRDKQKT
jgi:translin